jgi:hypothetical protein
MAYGIFKGGKGGNTLRGNFDISLIPARVLSVVLDPSTYPSTYNQNGKYASLGGITFRPLVKVNTSTEQEGTSFALPYFPNINHYPIEGELVLILAAGTTLNTDGTDKTAYYYLPPTNAWATNHINVAANNTNQQNNTPNNKSYKQVEAGAVNKEVPDYENTYIYKYGIKERANVRPLLPQPGDISFEGRWSNTVRLGSTNRSALPNTWSSVGAEGDPIIIIRNNQYQSTISPWIPLAEDINADGGSIYFTSTQKIPVTTLNFKVGSYSTNPPIEPKEYVKDQIILDSGRLLLVSKEESILLTAANSVHISATTFNVDTNSTTVNSKQIQLGGNSNLQPVLKGDDTVDCLDKLLTQLTSFMTVVAATNLPGISDSAKTIIPELSLIKIKVNTQIRSNVTATK